MDKLYKLIILFVGLTSMNLNVQAHESTLSLMLVNECDAKKDSVFFDSHPSIGISKSQKWMSTSFFPKANQATNFTNYPNPATTFTTVSYILTKKTNVVLKVIDLAGKQLVVLTKQEQNIGKQELYWDFAKTNITAGMYILLLQADNKTYSRKIIVQ